MANQHMRLRWSHAKNYLFTSRFRSQWTERWPENKKQQSTNDDRVSVVIVVERSGEKDESESSPIRKNAVLFFTLNCAISFEMFLRHKYSKIVTSLRCWNFSTTKFIRSSFEDFFSAYESIQVEDLIASRLLVIYISQSFRCGVQVRSNSFRITNKSSKVDRVNLLPSLSEIHSETF